MVVDLISLLFSLLQIMVKTILRQRSFKNPFNPGRLKLHARMEFQQHGRSYSAPESFDVLAKR